MNINIEKCHFSFLLYSYYITWSTLYTVISRSLQWWHATKFDVVHTLHDRAWDSGLLDGCHFNYVMQGLLCFILCRLFIIVQLLIGYVVYASFAIQFYVPMDFLEAPLMDILGFRVEPGKRLSKKKRLLKVAVENTFRGIVVTLLCKCCPRTPWTVCYWLMHYLLYSACKMQSSPVDGHCMG